MEQIFRVVLSLSVSGSLIGLLLLLFRPVTGRFFARRWTYYLWLLVIVRLLTPIHADVNLMDYLSNTLISTGTDLTDAGNRKELAAGSEYVQTQFETLQEEESGADDSNITDTTETSRDVVKVGRKTTFFFLVGIVWICGVMFAVLRRFYSYRRFLKEVCGTCKPVTDERVLNKGMEIRTRLGIGRMIPIYESDAVSSPMLIGFWKPCIYLPSTLLAQMSGREYDVCLILHHELIHYKRRDIWYKWLFQAALSVHWFNPLLYLFNRKFNVDCELACDEAVMALLSEEGRKDYGNVLLDVAQKNLCEESFLGKSPMMHKNIPTMTLVEEKCTLKERLCGIAHYHKRGIAIGLCSFVSFALFATVTIVCGAAGVQGSSEHTLYNKGNFVENFIAPLWEKSMWTKMWGDSFDLNQPIEVSSSGKAYRMYDDDALIAEDSESDWWRAWIYAGGDGSVAAQGFTFNGSDTLWILYANKETTLEVASAFNLQGGRFKVVCVRPDQTVQTLNESGEKNTVKITLSEGRNVIKMVGQKARLEHLDISYGGMVKRDFGAIYTGEEQEYAYQVLEGDRTFEWDRVKKACPHLEAKEVSALYRKAWEDEIVVQEENWEDLWLYSDVELSTQYLLEELQAGKIREFSSSVLCSMAPYMEEKAVSECFRCLLERGGVSESEWGDIFQYSDSAKSAKYLAEALRRGDAKGFSDRNLDQINYQVSTKSLTDIVTALDKTQLSFEGLLEYVLPFLQQQDEAATCVCYYIDLGNVLTDAQLQEIEGYLSEEDFYRVVEYNGRNINL